jgi:hypothetical protein
MSYFVHAKAFEGAQPHYVAEKRRSVGEKEPFLPNEYLVATSLLYFYNQVGASRLDISLYNQDYA